jgi:hypothetical protein
VRSTPADGLHLKAWAVWTDTRISVLLLNEGSRAARVTLRGLPGARRWSRDSRRRRSARAGASRSADDGSAWTAAGTVVGPPHACGGTAAKTTSSFRASAPRSSRSVAPNPPVARDEPVIVGSLRVWTGRARPDGERAVVVAWLRIRAARTRGMSGSAPWSATTNEPDAHSVVHRGMQPMVLMPCGAGCSQCLSSSRRGARTTDRSPAGRPAPGFASRAPPGATGYSGRPRMSGASPARVQPHPTTDPRDLVCL